MQKILLIAAFGAAGAVSRYLVGAMAVRWLGERFAYGTLVVNVVGCFFIGLLMYISIHHPKGLGEILHAAITTGLLGALTTFSTFSYETVRFIELERPTAALVNVLANVMLGLLAAWCGGLAGRFWVPNN